MQTSWLSRMCGHGTGVGVCLMFSWLTAATGYAAGPTASTSGLDLFGTPLYSPRL